VTAAIAVVALATALVVLGTAIATLVQTTRHTTQIAQIHVLVNSRLTAVIGWGNQLADILERHGIDVPAPPPAAGMEPRDGEPAERPDEPRPGQASCLEGG
jgi:hypothetical protein